MAYDLIQPETQADSWPFGDGIYATPGDDWVGWVCHMDNMDESMNTWDELGRKHQLEQTENIFGKILGTIAGGFFLAMFDDTLEVLDLLVSLGWWELLSTAEAKKILGMLNIHQTMILK